MATAAARLHGFFLLPQSEGHRLWFTFRRILGACLPRTHGTCITTTRLSRGPLLRSVRLHAGVGCIQPRSVVMELVAGRLDHRACAQSCKVAPATCTINSVYLARFTCRHRAICSPGPSNFRTCHITWPPPSFLTEACTAFSNWRGWGYGDCCSPAASAVGRSKMSSTCASKPTAKPDQSSRQSRRAKDQRDHRRVAATRWQSSRRRRP